MTSNAIRENTEAVASNNNRVDSESYEIIQTPYNNQEVSLYWEDIRFQVGELEILKGVTGISRPREVTAIMGSSGSGKTSLLSILSNQIFPNKKNIISGTIKLNDKLIKEVDFQSYVKYVMQQDILLPTLTPRESLRFAARLKVGGSTHSINQLVDELLEKLKISNVAENLIGNEYIKGLSGGEKKRLCIGMEMVSDSPVLILDEPTSGLDSHTAKLVIALLKASANEGKTILMTIHQPSEDIYEMIDTLILMASGNFIYQGPQNDARTHFDNLGYICQEHTPPPDHFMRILHIKNTQKLNKDEETRINLFISTYNSKATKIDLKHSTKEIPYTISNYKASLPNVLKICVERSFHNAKRNPMLFAVKMMQAVVMGTILALLFRDLGYGRTQVANRKGLLFFINVNVTFFGVIGNCLTFPVERPIMIKDYKEGLYGIIPYFFSKLVAELPVVFMFSLIYSLLCYFATDLNLESADKYFSFFGILFITHLCGMSIGNFAGSVSVDFEAANVFSSAFAAPLMLFGGFFSNTNSLSTAFEWIKYFSPFSRGYEAFILNEFEDLPYDKSDFSPSSPIEELGFHGEIWHKCGAMLLIILGCCILSLISMKILAEREKR